MEYFEKQEEVIDYLDKYYRVKDWFFFDRAEQQEWGLDIVRTIHKVFNYSEQLIEETLKSWAFSKGFSEEQYVSAKGTRRLRTMYSPEMGNDLAQYGIDVEQAMINILSQELAKEIDTQILKELRGEIKKTDELLEVVECMGYTTTQLIYDPTTFAPKKGFISMGYNEIKNARKNNTIWQNWVRTRGLHT